MRKTTRRPTLRSRRRINPEKADADDFNTILFRQYSNALSFEDFSECMAAGLDDAPAGNGVARAAEVAVLSQDQDYLIEVMREVANTIGVQAFRDCLRRATIGLRDAEDRSIHIAYKAARDGLRIDIASKSYMRIGANSKGPRSQLGNQLSRAVDKVMLYAEELGMTRRSEKVPFMSAVLRHLKFYVKARYPSGAVSESAQMAYERYAIAALSQFKAILSEKGIRTDNQYLDLVGED